MNVQAYCFNCQALQWHMMQHLRLQDMSICWSCGEVSYRAVNEAKEVI